MTTDAEHRKPAQPVRAATPAGPAASAARALERWSASPMAWAGLGALGLGAVLTLVWLGFDAGRAHPEAAALGVSQPTAEHLALTPQPAPSIAPAANANTLVATPLAGVQPVLAQPAAAVTGAEAAVAVASPVRQAAPAPRTAKPSAPKPRPISPELQARLSSSDRSIRRWALLEVGPRYPNVTSAKAAYRSGRITRSDYSDTIWVLKTRRKLAIERVKNEYDAGRFDRYTLRDKLHAIDVDYEGR